MSSVRDNVVRLCVVECNSVTQREAVTSYVFPTRKVSHQNRKCSFYLEEQSAVFVVEILTYKYKNER